MSLVITHLTGGYANVPILHDLDLTLQEGEVLGLIGLNGAGKSTTIKHLLGLIQPMKGKIELNGLNLSENPTAFKRQIGYIPETPAIYPELTLKEHLQLTMLAYGLDEKKAWPYAEQFLKAFRLEGKEDWLPIHFSKGMQQKVMITASLLAQPALLLIDEPFTGLDPLAAEVLLNALTQLRNDGKMILMTTHDLAQVKDVVDKFAILNHGTIEFCGDLSQIQQHYHLTRQDDFAQLYHILSQEHIR